MTSTQRFAAVALAGALLLAGFTFGRITDDNNASAEGTKAATTQPTQYAQTSAQVAGPVASNEAGETANVEEQAFYLKDYKVGYDDGYNAGVTGQMGNVPSTDREGYNEGFKEGYGDAVQTRNAPPVQAAPASVITRTVPVAYRGGQQTYYRPAYRPAPVARKRTSKLKTALTIAAPAAIGAGIGVAAGGKKGAAVGALVGGGGGALYHLIKNRNRD